MQKVRLSAGYYYTGRAMVPVRVVVFFFFTKSYRSRSRGGMGREGKEEWRLGWKFEWKAV
jgi:hypothetical protein